jgi:hypothetical protein
MLSILTGEQPYCKGPALFLRGSRVTLAVQLLGYPGGLSLEVEPVDPFKLGALGCAALAGLAVVPAAERDEVAPVTLGPAHPAGD